MDDTQQTKSVKKWVLLLILPIVALIFVALLQAIVRIPLASTVTVTEAGFETQSSNDIVKVVIDIFSFVVGTASVVAIFLAPLWLVLLVRDLKGHQRSKTVAVVLAIFSGSFSWIYTWEKNYKKFWIGLAAMVFTIGYGSIIVWIWAIIDNASKPNEFYANYNNTSPSLVPPATNQIG